jgi:hypothetical protein
MSDTGPITGRPPSDDEQMWLDMGRELVKGSIDAIEGTAKNLLVAVGVLAGLYFHAVSFEKVYDRMGPIAHNLGVNKLVVAVLFGLPALLWLLSSFAAMLALTATRHELQLDTPAEIASKVRSIAAEKYRWTRAGLVLLVVGLGVLSVNIFVYLAS